jgi:hypothetical protein
MTHRKVEKGKWTRKEGIAYLSENGIVTKYAESIVTRANKCRLMRDAFDNRQKEPEQWRSMRDRARSQPILYTKAPLPSIWLRGLPLHLFIDTVMHLLFLGVVKAAFVRVSTWANRAGRGPAFLRLGTRMLMDVEDLKLQWLTFNVKTFGGWGGWVSEKFQSLSRIALWLYSPLAVVDRVDDFVEPEKDVSLWLATDYKKYLKARGLDYSGKKAELKQRVIAIYNLPESEKPEKIPPDYGEAEGMLAMLRSMVMMLTTILQPGVDGWAHSNILSLRIRLFLSCFDRFDKPLRTRTINTYEPTAAGEKRKRGAKGERMSTKVTEGEPQWLTKYNFLCLLNLPEIVREFGPARNYFEGKYLGERYVQEVKTTRQRCPPRNLCGVLLQKLHQSKSLEAMVGHQSDKDIKTFQSTEAGYKRRKELKGNVRVYSSEEKAITEFHSGKPLSLVETEEGYVILFYINGCNRGEVGCLGIQRSGIESEVKDGLIYWKWELKRIGPFAEDTLVKDYVVFLPMLSRPNGGEEGSAGGGEFVTSEGIYTMVTKEWSPVMLDHFEYSRIGVQLEKKEKAELGVVRV